MTWLDRVFPGSPLRYPVLAAIAGAILYVAANDTVWRPFWSIHNDEAIAFSQDLLPLLWIGLAIAPLIAVNWPVWAAVVAALPLGLSAFADEHEWPFVVFADLLVVAVAGFWRRPVISAVVAAIAVLPVLLTGLGHATMLVPGGARIEYGTASGSDGAAMTVLAYAVVALLAIGLAYWLRADARRGLDAHRLAERSAEVEGQAAVVAERARLARDLHDVVAHHVSLIAVRAETAPYTEPEIGDAGRRVLTDIAADARMALDELRGVLGILGRTGAADRSPQPTWSDIPALVERVRAAGVDVRMEGAADAACSPGAGYAAYRLVQEALTNARRHAPGVPVDVQLEATGQLFTVRVANALSSPARPGSGHGLAGMRERVEALGGRFGTSDGGGVFAVEATIPQGVREGAV